MVLLLCLSDSTRELPSLLLNVTCRQKACDPTTDPALRIASLEDQSLNLIRYLPRTGDSSPAACAARFVAASQPFRFRPGWLFSAIPAAAIEVLACTHPLRGTCQRLKCLSVNLIISRYFDQNRRHVFFLPSPDSIQVLRIQARSLNQCSNHIYSWREKL